MFIYLNFEKKTVLHSDDIKLISRLNVMFIKT